jgi:hypothetical protein
MNAERREKQHRTARNRRPILNAGDRVRVRRGVKDPDFADVPLGGWVGTVMEIDKSDGDSMCLIEWSERTLRAIHPVFKARCERDGLEYQKMWLAEEDLEPDEGPAAPIEEAHPSSRLLCEKDQDDRVRAALGLTSDDPLPDVDEQALDHYHAHLSVKLRFPFEATASEETGPLETNEHEVEVIGLLDTEEYDVDESHGLVCEVREGGRQHQVPLGELSVTGDDDNAQLVGDYAYWFWNHR